MAAAGSPLIPKVVAASFRGGIDRRRSPFASSNEVLIDALNVHVTPGGDIEKRRSFVLVTDLPAGTVGLHTVGDEIYVFGTDPEPSGFPISTSYGEIKYHRLYYTGSLTLTKILKAFNYAGLIYTIALFDNYEVRHFYDGAEIEDWITISEPVASNSAVLNKFKEQLDATGLYGTVTVSGSTLIVEMADEEEHSASASVEHLGYPTDGDLALTSYVEPVQSVEGAEAVGILTFVSRGTSGTMQMTNINVETDTLTDLLNGSSQVWASGVTPEDFATQVKNAINAATSVHGWTATTVGNSVWFSPPAGTYAAGNGINCYYVKSNIQIAQPKDPAVGYVTQGGQNPVTGNPQSFTFTISGTFSDRAIYSITIDGSTYSVRGYDIDPPQTAIVHRSRIIAPTDTYLYLSAIEAPRRWLSGIGYGYINIESQSPDGDPITALCTFAQNLAIFQKNSAQIWSIPPDESQAALIGMIQSIGCLSPDGVLDVGGNDTIFISRTGIRSLRARTLTDAPFVSDIGSPVDEILKGGRLSYFSSNFDITEEMLSAARIVMNPVDGRIWVVIGNDYYSHIVLVLSLFPEPGGGVRAWTTYTLPISPHYIATNNKYLFVRSDDSVYCYGGLTGRDTSIEPNTVQYGIITPYYSKYSLGVATEAIGLMFLCTGEWEASVYHSLSGAYGGYDEIGTVTENSRLIAPFRTARRDPSFAIKLSSSEAGEGSISQIMMLGHGSPIP